MRLSPRARVIVLLGGTALSGLLLGLYEELRRARRGDFPFLFEPLFLHGLLLVAIGIIGAIMVKVGTTGGRGIGVLASILIGVPSAVLALAPYLIAVLDWGFVPARLVGDGLHQIGVLGVGAALAVIVLGVVAEKTGTKLDSDAD